MNDGFFVDLQRFDIKRNTYEKNLIDCTVLCGLCGDVST